MIRFKSIASGSNGNCIYVGTDHTHVLVDAGITCKRILEGLNTLDLSGNDLSGILITHEHSDHIQGLKVLLKKYPVPLFGTRGTLDAIKMLDTKGEIDEALYNPISLDTDFTLGDFTVKSTHVSHDAKDPSAYRLMYGGKSAAVMTDLGFYDDHTVSFLKGVNGLLLESNHEIRMLEMGHYPYQLKRRILGDFGHLSNEMSGKLLSTILHDDLAFTLLGHLSEENNHPDICFMTVTQEVDNSENEYSAKDFNISVAKRTESSDLYMI